MEEKSVNMKDQIANREAGDPQNMKNQINKQGVILTYDKGGNPFLSIPCGGFPAQFFNEWEADCKKLFGGVRWMKMWHDHCKVKQFNLELELEMYKSALLEAQQKAVERVEQDVNPLGLLNGGN